MNTSNWMNSFTERRRGETENCILWILAIISISSWRLHLRVYRFSSHPDYLEDFETTDDDFDDFLYEDLSINGQERPPDC